MGSNLETVISIFEAGFAFIWQAAIGSLAGYFNILTGNIFRVGNMIKMGNVGGDALYISLSLTTIMEIGEWARVEQYTGRAVNLTDRVVFVESVFNYMRYSHDPREEIITIVIYDTDWRQAVEIMLEKWRELMSRFHFEAIG